MITTGRVCQLVLGHLARCPARSRWTQDTRTVHVKLTQQASYYYRPIFVFVRSIGSSTIGIEKDSLKGKLEDYPEQKISIYTCENLYKTWRKEKKFFFVPESGVNTNITFVDTMVNMKGQSARQITASSPTVLCIHGIPGNYNVFSHLIKDFGNRGIRAIVPNFPDVLYLRGKHKDELFRHSVEEKTQVFKDFLAALNVSQVDCIIAHSSAIYPALRLALDPQLNVKCQILFNTGGHKKTNTMKPYSVVWTCTYMFLHPWGRSFIMKTGKAIMKYILRSPIKDDNMYGIMLLAITMVFSEYWKTKELFYELVRRELPTLLCFSEDDKVVERSLTYDVLQLLDVKKENISFYDEEAKLMIKGKDKSWLRILSFKKGSHYVFRKHPEICNREALNIMYKSIPGLIETGGKVDNFNSNFKDEEIELQSSMDISDSFLHEDTIESGQASKVKNTKAAV